VWHFYETNLHCVGISRIVAFRVSEMTELIRSDGHGRIDSASDPDQENMIDSGSDPDQEYIL